MKKSNFQLIRLLFGMISLAATLGYADVFAQTKATAPSVTVYKTPT
ncbi:MAG: hypothetical protein QOF64_650 [Candidatus Binatota bacterium]|nr:hypothetical protein [Candidatus Binatota bacterium]